MTARFQSGNWNVFSLLFSNQFGFLLIEFVLPTGNENSIIPVAWDFQEANVQNKQLLLFVASMYQCFEKNPPPFSSVSSTAYNFTVYPVMACAHVHASTLFSWLSDKHRHCSRLSVLLFLDSSPAIAASSGSWSRRSSERKRQCN